MRILTLTVAFVAMALLAARGQAAQSKLDGKSFQGTMITEGKKPISDTFAFANGQFHSSACDQYGFGRAAYSAQPDGRFSATTFSASEGTIEWHGKIEGDKLQGEAVWLKPGKAPVRYQIQGTLE
jgi:hypothetical protein